MTDRGSTTLRCPGTADGVFDVAIIGCGPTGAALANLLGRRGLRVAVIDRHRGVTESPRAVHFDGETMRAFQGMGLHREVLDIVRPGHGMRWVNQDGETLLWRTGLDGIGPQGWHNDYYFHQPALERVLRAGIGRCPTVSLFENFHVAWHVAGADAVVRPSAGVEDDAVNAV